MIAVWDLGIGQLILLLMVLVMLVAVIVPCVLYVLTLQRALSRCRIECRRLSPGLVWLLFIPLFNSIWHFVVVTNVSKSLGAEFQKRNIVTEPNPGQGIGLAMCILVLCSSVIPFLGIPIALAARSDNAAAQFVLTLVFIQLLMGLPAFICWIIYWIKVAGFSAKIATPPALSSVVQVNS